MKAAHIVQQLADTLPDQTVAFSDVQAVALQSTPAGTGSIVTATTATPHGITTGDAVTIRGATTPNAITAVVVSGTQATLTTSVSHDLTADYHRTAVVTSTRAGNESAEYAVLSVPSRTSVVIDIGTDSLSLADAPVLQEVLYGDCNGRHTVSVASPTTFSFGIVRPYTGDFAGTPLVHRSIRVSAAVSAERALEAYTPQPADSLWAFVVLENTTISRDRDLLNDAVSLQMHGHERRIREIEPFSVYVVFPTTNEIAAADTRDQVDDVAPMLYRSIVGFAPPSGLSEERRFAIVPVGTETFGYTKAYMVQRFMFEVQRDITSSDMLLPGNNTAFRDAAIQMRNPSGRTISSTAAQLDIG